MKIVAVEGLDKAGKRATVERLKEKFEADGLTVVDYTFPSEGTPIGQLIQDWQMDAVSDARTFELLQAADKQNAQTLFTMCEGFQVDVFLVDRYVHALWANGALSCEPAWLAQLTHHMRLPDAVVYLDVDPEVSLMRQGVKLTDKRLSEARRIRDAYLASFVGSEMPILQIDANAEPVFVAIEVELVAKRLLDVFDLKVPS